MKTIKIKIQNTKKQKLKRKIDFINKQRRHTILFPKSFYFFNLKDFIFINIFV